MKNIISLLLTFTGFSLMSAQSSVGELLKKLNSGEVAYISVEELRMLQLNGSVLIIDAREPEEFAVSRIKGARLAGFKNFSLDELKDVSKNSNVVVYCSLGVRSEKIGNKLQKAGFRNVQNLYGGIFEWKNNNYPIVDREGKETDSIHVFSKKWSKWSTNGIKVY